MSRTFPEPPVHVTRRADNRADPSFATLRDRAIIGTIRYANASVDAVTALRVKDYYSVSNRRWLRIFQDGVERHQLVDAKLESLLDSYLLASGIKDEPNSLLF